MQRFKSVDLAYRAFAGLWVVATLTLLIGRDLVDALAGAVTGAVWLLEYALTRRLTDPAIVLPAPPHPRAATFVLALTILLTTLDPITRYFDLSVPVWTALHTGIADTVAPAFGGFVDWTGIDNVLRYVAFPGAVLIALGWRACDLGCGRSRRGTLQAVLLWCALPATGYTVTALALGHGKLAALGHTTWNDLFHNGYAEELLWRGGVLRASTARYGNAAGNVVAGLLFGGWHCGANLGDLHGNVVMALADGVATQAVAGIAFGLLTLRTGNVLAAGAVHAIYDAGQVFA